MFDLEQAIRDWHRRMTVGGIKDSSILDELESHLREEIKQRMNSGVTPEQAFKSAVRSLGQMGALKAEFAKVEIKRETRVDRFILVCGVVPASVMVIIGAVCLPARDLAWSGRCAGFGVVALLGLYVVGLAFAYRYLPCIKSRPMRRVAQLAGTFVCLAVGILLMDYVLPLLNLPTSALAITLWALMSIVAVLPWIPYGLMNDAQHLPPDAGGPSQPPVPVPIPPRRPVPAELTL